LHDLIRGQARSERLLREPKRETPDHTATAIARSRAQAVSAGNTSRHAGAAARLKNGGLDAGEAAVAGMGFIIVFVWNAVLGNWVNGGGPAAVLGGLAFFGILLWRSE
jgi:hypothetical protein